MTVDKGGAAAVPSVAQRRVVAAAFADLMGQETQLVRVPGAELRYALNDLGAEERDHLIDSCVPTFLERLPDADDYMLTLEGFLESGDSRPALIVQAVLELLRRKWNGPNGRRTRSFLWSEVRRSQFENRDFRCAWHTIYSARISQTGGSIGPARGDEGNPDFDYEFHLYGVQLEQLVKASTVSEYREYLSTRIARASSAPGKPSDSAEARILEPSPRDVVPEPLATESVIASRAVILTALRVEYEAVRALLQDLEEDLHAQGTVYERGWLLRNKRRWIVVIAEIGAGNSPVAVEAERAINHFAPDVAMFVGVAGGIKDVKIGDVVAATKVYGYESGKEKKGFEPRPDVGRSSFRMEHRARAEARKDDWRDLAPKNTRQPTVFVAPIAAGEKVVANKRGPIARFISRQYGDALAVEMEGRGFLEATHANHLDAIVIRGVSDLLSKKSAADRQGSQKRAAAHAAAFALHILSRFDPPTLRREKRVASATSGRSRDLETLKRLLVAMPTVVLDFFFERAALDFIPAEIFHYWETFNAEVSAGHFHVFDAELRDKIRDLHAHWGQTLSFGGRFTALPDGKTSKFVGPRHGENYKEWTTDHDAFHRAVDQGQAAYQRLLDHLKEEYGEIDLLEAGELGIANYRAYQGKDGDDDPPPLNSAGLPRKRARSRR